MNGAALDSPTTGPKIKIGDSEYETKWSFYAEFLLSSSGTTLKEVLDECNAGGKRALVLAMNLIAACIGHHFPSDATPTGAMLALRMKDGQFKPALDGCIVAGKLAGAIVDRAPKLTLVEGKEKNETAPVQPGPSETAPQA